MIAQINVKTKEVRCFDIRKLSPRECGRLMDVPEWALDRLLPAVSNSAAYKLFGNSIVVSCLKHIYRQIWFYRKEQEQQLRLFDDEQWPEMAYDGHPLRVVTVCSGYDAQCLALDALREEHPELTYDLVAWSEFDPESKKPLAEQPAVVAHNAIYPQWADRNMGDMTTADWQSLHQTDIDLLTYSTPCFVAGTLVQTEGGLMPIEQVREGDRVLTHTRQWQEVAATGVKPFTGELYTIRSMCSHDIHCTPEHPFYVRRMRRVGHDWHRTFDQPEWTPARELTKAHYLGMAIDAHSDMPDWQGAIDNRWGHGRIVNEVGPMMQRQEFWYLIGRYVGDGWRRWDDTHKAIIICCADREADRKPIVERMEAIGLHYIETCERTVRRITVNSRELAEFVTRYGYRADGKHIDTETLRLPQELLRSFVEGYMAADGHYDEQMHHWRCTTVSRELAYGLAQCVAKAYHAVPKVYYVRRSPQVVIEGRTCHQRNQWCVHYKTEVCPQDKAFYDDGYIWFPISNITTAQVSDVPVYNLEVSGDNSYTANNAIVHNCTDISQAGKRQGIAPGSGTRSAILWHTEEAIRQLSPRFLIQENVAALVNEQNRPWFDQWRQVLTRLGYDSAWTVMNARQFGVPQNRERVFCVSWRRDLFPYRAVFPFPKPFPLTRCIADVLEPDASSALYLKPESATSFLQKNEDGQQQYIYATVSHRPTSTQIDALIAEQTTE